jgi:hypothetical protein
MSQRSAALSARVSSEPQAAAPTIASPVTAFQARVALEGLVLPEAMPLLDEG